MLESIDSILTIAAKATLILAGVYFTILFIFFVIRQEKSHSSQHPVETVSAESYAEAIDTMEQTFDASDPQARDLPAPNRTVAIDNNRSFVKNQAPRKTKPDTIFHPVSVGAAATNYDNLTLSQLRSLARNKIPGFMKLKKSQLLKALKDANAITA